MSASLPSALEVALRDGGRYVTWVRRRAGGRVDAEEVVQAALARALERADQLRQMERASSWVRQIVLNTLRDELRKRREQEALDEDQTPSVGLQDGVACHCAAFQATLLKPEYATILHRAVMDGVPVTQVADELGLTPNNAMVRLHRARKALRARLEAHCGMTSAQSCSDCGCLERGCCQSLE